MLEKLMNLELTIPLFPIEMWNNFDLVAYGIPTTTNSVKAWHAHFRQLSHHITLPFGNFVKHLRLSNLSVELRQAQHYSGKPPD